MTLLLSMADEIVVVSTSDKLVEVCEVAVVEVCEVAGVSEVLPMDRASVVADVLRLLCNLTAVIASELSVLSD